MQVAKMLKILFFVWLLFICFGQVKAQKNSEKKAPLPANDKVSYTYLLTNSPSGGYGYYIFRQGKLLIRQDRVPGQPGLQGFTDTITAGKCARLVMLKLSKGINPPTVSKEELVKLGVPIPNTKK